jgi:hypothetical protein
MATATLKPLTTYEMVTLALYLEGGALKSVDTEDVAMRTNTLAPGRFTWRKYKDQIDLNLILISLRHAKRKQNGELVSGDASTGWRLTEAGRASALGAQARVEGAAPKGSGLSKAEEKWAQHERKRLFAETAFEKWATDDAESIKAVEAERFFKVDEYIRGDRRKAFVSRICNVFADDPQLGPASARIKLALPEE